VSPSTGRRAAWWQLAVESGDLVALEPREPWAGLEIDGEPVELDLSDDQRALLEGAAGAPDQPPVPRLRQD
jgi:hypothetical protein